MLVAPAETSSLRQASNQLHVSQSSLSVLICVAFQIMWHTFVLIIWRTDCGSGVKRYTYRGIHYAGASYSLGSHLDFLG
jgi:hypothetical protein